MSASSTNVQTGVTSLATAVQQQRDSDCSLILDESFQYGGIRDLGTFWRRTFRAYILHDVIILHV